MLNRVESEFVRNFSLTILRAFEVYRASAYTFYASGFLYLTGETDSNFLQSSCLKFCCGGYLNLIDEIEEM